MDSTLFVPVAKQFQAFPDEPTKLPTRNDPGSAGYDFYAKEDIEVPGLNNYTISELNPSAYFAAAMMGNPYSSIIKTYTNGQVSTTTDVAVQLPPGKFLLLVPRSSLGIKRHLMIANTTGIIDGSYYGNPTNGGNIGCTLRNLSNDPVTIHKGERYMQGIIMSYGVTDDDQPRNQERIGGTGSSDQQK